METPILILKDALIQQNEQLKLAEKRRHDYKNEKQMLFKEKGIENLKGFIAEIEKAIAILESEGNKQPESNEEHSVSHGVKQRYLVSDVIFVEIKDGKITDKLGAEISTEFIVKHEHFLGKGWGYIIL